VTGATIASWGKHLDEEGPSALLRSSGPVNKFPDFVRGVVQRLQTLCPRLGKVKIAQILARAGLHLAASSVGRIRRESPVSEPAPVSAPSETMPSARADFRGFSSELSVNKSPPKSRWTNAGAL
jgi:hypothetical protein